MGAVLVFAILAAAGQSLGRAQPTGNYRPDLVADPLRIGCHPLPDDIRLTFPYVVRRDSVVVTATGERRSLTLHWSLLSLDDVRARLRVIFTRAGYQVIPRDTTSSQLSLFKARPTGRPTRVSAQFMGLKNLSPDPIVRGVLQLDLPVDEHPSHNAACSSPYVTKRFAEAR